MAWNERIIDGRVCVCGYDGVTAYSVNVVLVDYEGNRHFIQGRQGQTLRQACEMNNVGLVKDDSNGGGGVHSAVRADYYTESLFGEGGSPTLTHDIMCVWRHGCVMLYY